MAGKRKQLPFATPLSPRKKKSGGRPTNLAVAAQIAATPAAQQRTIGTWFGARQDPSIAATTSCPAPGHN